MDIYFHNTQSGRKERFVPLEPAKVGVYVCGPTVYDLQHIGNGFSAVVFDVLIRLLKVDYDVTYVRNITDIDDKINAAALANGTPIGPHAEHFAAEFQHDVAALGVSPPDVEPRATGHIDEIVAMIGELIDAGNAYAADGHVLFHVPSDPAYGTLARRSLEHMLDGARVEVAPYKKDPKDFVLWKPSTPELPGWPSPWGRGRPGWHIECSAMVRKHLGTVIDIHGGGSDLTFPHHENEAAQSRCANGGGLTVRYWLHNGMLTMAGEKMSKSVGNIVTIRELLTRHDGETLRYALLSGHYRQSLSWSEALIAQAKASLGTLYGALRDTDDGQNETSTSHLGAASLHYPETVLDALRDDLNTPQALAAMHALASEVRRASDAKEIRHLRTQLLAGGALLGILGRTPSAFFRGDDADTDAIDALIAERDRARKDRDYARADEIRNQLAGMGVDIEDTREGTRWKRA